ncbi:MAG TPA: DUF4301 family protein, partial [Candidatus Polarisedimenticolia bacterium]|nr:DUF4301 family protein [Candidatus Polarisedimenticolia bacterium]
MAASSHHGRLTDADQVWLERQGVPLAEALRQLALLAGPRAHILLERPCALGDGIEVIAGEELESLARQHDQAAREGRLLSFVPASGLASRMFTELLAYRDRAGDLALSDLDAQIAVDRPEARAFRAFLDGLHLLAFSDELKTALSHRGLELDQVASSGPYRALLESLLSTPGLGYEQIPKGLVAFHRYADGPRTPIEEHLVEAAGLVKDGDDRCRLHFTVPASHEGVFAARLQQVRTRYETRFGVRYQVDLSTQHPGTDTLALDSDGSPLRNADGRLVLRPSGHGALLENLDGLRADIVLIKNIDNVAPDRLKGPTF